MKVSATKIFMVLLLALGACSSEDQQPAQTPPPKVVRPIKPSVQEVEKPAAALAEEKKPQAEEKAPVEKPVVSPDKPEGRAAATAEEKKVASEEPTVKQPKKKVKEEPGTYLVKKGDSLSSIAARADVLKDPLKWTILLSLNKDKLGEWASGEDVPEKDLPQGIRLNVITAREARGNLKKEAGSLWVVNVLSTLSSAEIVPPAVTLVKQGYPVYIVRANVNGKEYMRLRVGFFKNRSQTDAMGKKIKDELKFQDSWSTRANKEEYEAVAGFFKTMEKR